MKNYVCSNCGFVGKSKIHGRGSFLLGVSLRLCFIVPGTADSRWRSTSASSYKACPKCKSPNMILENNMKEQKLSNETSS